MSADAAVHEHGNGTFAQVRGVPAAGLGGIVLSYTGYSHRGASPYRRREPAQDRVTLILNLGPRLLVEGPGFEQLAADSFVAPLSDTYAITEEGESLHGVQVDLSPLGAHMVFGMPMTEFSELIVDLEAVLGRDFLLLVEALHECSGWGARFTLLDAFFIDRLEGAIPPSPDVAWAWDRLARSGGAVRVGSLAAELRCSNRHLNARFREQVGLGPKSVARIMRFRRAVELLGGDDGRRFAEIAHDCGFYDQAHMNRDFGALAGTTPGDYVAKSLPAGFGASA